MRRHWTVFIQQSISICLKKIVRMVNLFYHANLSFFVYKKKETKVECYKQMLLGEKED